MHSLAPASTPLIAHQGQLVGKKRTVATSFGKCDTAIRSFGSRHENKRSYLHVISVQAQYIEDQQLSRDLQNCVFFAIVYQTAAVEPYKNQPWAHFIKR